LINGLPTGAIRVSLGYCSIQKDSEDFVEFLRNSFIEISDENFQVIKIENSARKEQYFKVNNIFIYPVKSCAPLEIDSSWQLCDSGFLYDRNWILIDSNQIPLTQKRLPQLAALQPQIDIKRNLFMLSFDGQKFEMPLEIDDMTAAKQVNVCAHKIFGFDCGDEVAQWLQDIFQLNEPIRLVRVSPQLMQDSKCVLKLTEKKSFVNQGDFLLISLNSIRKLRSFLLDSLDLDSRHVKEKDLKSFDEELVKQFRANFVIEVLNETSDCGFDEENWNKMRILNRDLEFVRTNLCTRCQMINLNQNSNTSKDENDNLDEKACRKSLADAKVDFNQLLKQLYKLKTNSKFGIYISRISKNDNSEAMNGEIDTGSSIQVENSLIKKQKNEMFIGDIGLADFI
jgi:molybdenum cofactor sulfurtransferase